MTTQLLKVGSDPHIQQQRPSTLRSVYSVGDIDGVVSPPILSTVGNASYAPNMTADASHLRGFSAFQPTASSAHAASNTLTAVPFRYPTTSRSYSGPRSLPSQPKRKAGLIGGGGGGGAVNGVRVASGPVSIKSVQQHQLQTDQLYASLVPKTLRRKSSESASNTTQATNNVSDPPPSYSPPRKTSSEDSINRSVSRRSGTYRRPRSRRESRQPPPDTESDQTSSTKEYKKPSSASTYNCGCPTSMNKQWSVQNSTIESGQWSHHDYQQAPQQHQRLLRTEAPPSVPFRKISHKKYPNGDVDLDPSRDKRRTLGSHDSVGSGVGSGHCCSPHHHTCHHQQRNNTCPQASGYHSCCNSRHNTCSIVNKPPLQGTEKITVCTHEKNVKDDIELREGQLHCLLDFTYRTFLLICTYTISLCTFVHCV